MHRIQEIQSRLDQMKTTELRKTAIAEGVDSIILDGALDSDTPRFALIEVLLQHHLQAGEQSIHEERALRSELQRLKMAELRKRAAALSLGYGQLDEAMDSDTPKAALIELLLQHLLDQKVLRSELQELRITEVRKRAVAEGVGSEMLDEALDSDDPKDALIELLLQHLRTTKATMLPELEDDVGEG